MAQGSNTSQASLFLLCTGKSEPTRLHPEEFKLEAEIDFFHTTVDGTTKQSLHMEIFAHSLCFQANLCLHFRSPLTCTWLYHTGAWNFISCRDHYETKEWRGQAYCLHFRLSLSRTWLYHAGPCSFISFRDHPETKKRGGQGYCLKQDSNQYPLNLKSDHVSINQLAMSFLHI